MTDNGQGLAPTAADVVGGAQEDITMVAMQGGQALASANDLEQARWGGAAIPGSATGRSGIELDAEGDWHDAKS